MGERIIHSIEDFVRRLITALNDCGTEYLLIGGVAAMYYGRPRSTLDCDIALSLAKEEIKKFCARLRKAGFDANEDDVRAAFDEGSHFNAYYKGEYGYRADFSWRKSSLEEYGFRRAQKKKIFGVVASVEAPEDIIVAKLVYGSQQDFEDAVAVLKRQKNIDRKYLKKRAEEEGVKNRLERLFRFAGE